MGLVASWVIFISIFVCFDLKPGSGVKFDYLKCWQKNSQDLNFICTEELTNNY